MIDPQFWAGRRVLVTGHTGFKGAWLCAWLRRMGAEVHGLALAPEGEPNLFALIGDELGMTSHIGDIRDADAVASLIAATDPEICLHMAAQALVRRSYRQPVETFAANVMGTAHVLEGLRHAPSLKAAIIVTSDKAYHNPEDGRPLREGDPLGGDDPYSASKGATELVARAWAKSFYDGGAGIHTARAGNVIGGGDWSEDRLVPDIWRAARSGRALVLRYPDATRPWQHVLEPLAGYLAFAEAAARGRKDLPPALNFGPLDAHALSVGTVAERLLAALAPGLSWQRQAEEQPPEKKLLALDPSLAGRVLGWRPLLDADETLDWTVAWYKGFDRGEAAIDLTRQQIARYMRLLNIETDAE